ncbi:uncharacterized protein LOC141613958 [Silene latifolia]|uniref:uncharacterized protein LOC141613958 n=1 Tax=Silene latifolia TaxID=37657 RepID=UPI003D76E246
MVYGFNRIDEREVLWESLCTMSRLINGPWVVLRDFNNVLAMNERIGSETSNAELKGFQDCVAYCGLMDIFAQGAFFTRNNKHEVGAMVFSRIDRALITDDCLDRFPDTLTTFHPEGIFDHFPCTMVRRLVVEKRRSNFKYFDMWGHAKGFLNIVRKVWDTRIDGVKMFQIVKKLKALKRPLKELNGDRFSNIETSAEVAKLHMFEVQRKLQSDPINLQLQAEAKDAADAYRELDEARRKFLVQKAKAQWMKYGF